MRAGEHGVQGEHSARTPTPHAPSPHLALRVLPITSSVRKRGLGATRHDCTLHLRDRRPSPGARGQNRVDLGGTQLLVTPW